MFPLTTENVTEEDRKDENYKNHITEKDDDSGKNTDVSDDINDDSSHSNPLCI